MRGFPCNGSWQGSETYSLDVQGGDNWGRGGRGEWQSVNGIGSNYCVVANYCSSHNIVGMSYASLYAFIHLGSHLDLRCASHGETVSYKNLCIMKQWVALRIPMNFTNSFKKILCGLFEATRLEYTEFYLSSYKLKQLPISRWHLLSLQFAM